VKAYFFLHNADNKDKKLKGGSAMKITVNGKNVEITSALQEYAVKKVTKISKFFEKSPLGAQVTLKTERGKNIVDLTIQVDGLLLRGEAKTDDMYGSIDEAIDKVERQIHKYKTRINRKFHPRNRVVIEAPANLRQAGQPQIKRTKRFTVKPMLPEEAVMQMDLLGHDFYLFQNSDTEELNVVYKRKDGHYGLIEPEM
jgi:putative sigma-54 modulation protein